MRTSVSCATRFFEQKTEEESSSVAKMDFVFFGMKNAIAIQCTGKESSLDAPLYLERRNNMSGTGKHFVWLDYLTAYEVAWRGGIVSLDALISGTSSSQSYPPQESGYGMRFLDSLESDLPSPEDTLLKKEAFTSLSAEAKEVILLILNSPQEILDCLLTPKYNKISKDRLLIFLTTTKGWKPKVVAKCFKELKEFSSDLG